MSMKRSGVVLLSVLWLFAARPAWAENSHCEQIGGVVMTNIGAIAGVTNLGPAFGDLQGAVAATILGQNNDGSFNVQHYWVTTTGDTIKFNVAHLKPTAARDVVAVRWGDYIAEIVPGGTGKFANATGRIEAFGLADFNQLTLVLRYRGELCYNDTDKR
jgi:hypothetical protein